MLISCVLFRRLALCSAHRSSFAVGKTVKKLQAKQERPHAGIIESASKVLSRGEIDVKDAACPARAAEQ
jgi:hypothetical protein